MKGLPDELPADGTEAFTGLVCPDCNGNLVVKCDAGYVSFHCRVGHAYSIPELIAAKESGLEGRLWAAVFGFEELAALLESLEAHRLSEHLGSRQGVDRAVLAHRQSKRLRSIVQDDRPLISPDQAMGGAVGPSSP